ncbi:MAG: glycosyltransferase family 2 protein [Candidatus Margulisiibacteriota bacterium]
MTLLSLCIPTYNRSHFLDECLASLFSQENEMLADSIEICVSDNHSEDDTERVVEKWKRRGTLKITYYRHDKNMGADINFLKVIEIASGEYCWFVGSDDHIAPGAVRSFLEAVDHYHADIYIVRKQNYDVLMKSKRLTPDPVQNVPDSLININDHNKDCCAVLSALGYIGALAFKRTIWIDAVSDQEYLRFVGSAYVHVYAIQRMIRRGSTVFCLKDVFIHWRSENDSILQEQKAFGRFQIEINYCLITETLFKKRSPESRFVANFIIRNNMSPMLFEFKMQGAVSLKFLNLAFRHLGSRKNFYIWLLPVFLIPQPLLVWIKTLYRLTIKRFVRV